MRRGSRGGNIPFFPTSLDILSLVAWERKVGRNKGNTAKRKEEKKK